ncbi:MAG: glycosyltransferase family 39 protein [Caldilineaceae bacterium]|nr:glycosyltransferase family 39 protein [Caldilineaceae bacterium]
MTSSSTARSSLWIYTLLGLVLLAGLTLRTWNVRWDAGMNTHPDERSTTCWPASWVALPASWDEFRDPRRSPLNPLWDANAQQTFSFTYGHFPLYLGVGMGEVLHRLAPVAGALPISERIVTMMARANEGCGGVAVAGRLMMALLDTLTIFLLFLLGRRIYGPWAGLLAATFYAFAAQAIQLSHFFAMDPASTTFTVLAVLGGVLMTQDRSWRAAILTGIGAGLAISSKFSALPILAVPVVAAGIVLWQERESGEGRAVLRVIWGALLALLVAGASFAVTSPYAILDWENFIQFTLVQQGAMVRGVADFPFTRQYRNTLPYIYFIEQQVAWGLWWPLGVLALMGTAWALGSLAWGLIPRLKNPTLKRARAGELMAWAWLVPYFGLTGAFLAKFNRYMSPVLPFVLLFAAGMIWTIGNISTQRRRGAEAQRESDTPRRSLAPSLPRSLAILLAVIGIGGGLFWSLAYVNGVYNTLHPWEQAARWMAEYIAPDSVVLCEQWDDCMPWGVPDAPEINAANSQIRRIDWGPYEEDTAQKYEILRQRLREADYVAYSSKRIYGSVAELPQRYPMTTRYYELMFSGDLGFEIAAEFSTPPTLFGLTFPDHTADESWSLYDHPQVTIFRKVRNLSDAEFAQLLGGTWESAIPYYRGEDSPIDPLLNALGLGSSPGHADGGLVNTVIALLRGEPLPASPQPAPEDRKDLSLGTPLNALPVVDDYRWNVQASENHWLGAAWWWLVISILGWLAWPLAFVIFRPLRDRGYFLSRALGWLLAGWLLWLFASFDLAHNTVINAWLAAALVGVLGLAALVWNWREMSAFLRRSAPLLLVGEAIFAAAFVLFLVIRMYNPDLWQPWFGGEKFMEFAFLNGILRSPTFPPVNPHFAGGFINYYYFGIYLVAFVIKLTGVYAEVAFNLAIAALFALTVINAFGVAYSAVTPWQRADSGRRTADRRPQTADSGRWTADDKPQMVDGERSTTDSNTQYPIPNTRSPVPDPQSPTTWDFSDYRSWGRPPLAPNPQPQPRPLPVAPTSIEVLEIDTATGETHLENLELGTRQQRPEIRSRPIPSPQSPVPNPQSPLPWQRGLGWALLAPLFVAIIGNLDAFAQIVRRLIEFSRSDFQSAIPGITPLVHAASGLWTVITTDARLSGYDFWAPSRVIPATINEFPYWSFTFADLHPHMIGIPFSVLFLGLVLTVLASYTTDWRRHWGYAALLLGTFALMLGTLASINLWELPTYYGLGVLALAVAFFRGRGRMDWPLLVGFGVFYLAGAYLLFWPFFRNYANVGASGVGLVRAPDDLGQWLLIWGFFIFALIGWMVYTVTRPARPSEVRATGLERWLSLLWQQLDRLPRFIHLHGLLVDRPSIGYLLGRALLPILFIAAAFALWREWTVIALCLPLLGLGFLLLWRRGSSADPGSLLVALLTTTGFALLAGTQIVFLRDFLEGGDWYRMNTLFKFFIQVWVLFGIAAAVGVARILGQTADGGSQTADRRPQMMDQYPIPNPQSPIWRNAWTVGFALLLAVSFAYPIVGTPARSDQRFPGWRPEIGTLDALDFMRQGSYTWPDGSNRIELAYDWQALQWILDSVRGNLVIVESSETDYYRAGGTRMASMSGLSGIHGKHEGEQRYGDIVGERGARFGEFWNTPDIGRTQQLIDELGVDLIYVGQLEQYLHPQGVDKLTRMAEMGMLIPIYENDRATIYAVQNRLIRTAEGYYYPAPRL